MRRIKVSGKNTKLATQVKGTPPPVHFSSHSTDRYIQIQTRLDPDWIRPSSSRNRDRCHVLSGSQIESRCALSLIKGFLASAISQLKPIWGRQFIYFSLPFLLYVPWSVLHDPQTGGLMILHSHCILLWGFDLSPKGAFRLMDLIQFRVDAAY